MFGSLSRPGMAALRILIITGALVSITQPRIPYHLTRMALITFQGRTVNALRLDERSLVRLALTAIGLSLL
jgi:hypothetical protein